MKIYEQAITKLALKASNRFFGGEMIPISGLDTELVSWIYGIPVKVVEQDITIKYNRIVSVAIQFHKKKAK